MSGERRWSNAPHAGDYVHFHTMSCEPCDLWGIVFNAHAGGGQFTTRMLDTGQIEHTEIDYPRDHLTLWIEPPDEYFVWQAKLVLLKDLTN